MRKQETARFSGSVPALCAAVAALLIACSGDRSGEGLDGDDASGTDGTTSGISDCEPDPRTQVPSFTPPLGATDVAVDSAIVFELVFDPDSVVPADCWREWNGVLYHMTSTTSAEEVPGSADNGLVDEGCFRWQFTPDELLPENSRLVVNVALGPETDGKYVWEFETGANE